MILKENFSCLQPAANAPRPRAQAQRRLTRPMPAYRYILFDLDGTLTDSAEGITKCVQYGLRAVGVDEPDLKKLLVFVGPPLRDTAMKYYGLSREQAESCIAKYRERYEKTGIWENGAYPGVTGLLKELYRSPDRPTLAICTGKPEVYARPIAERYGFAPYLADIVGCDLAGRLDEKRLVVAAALQRLKISTPQQRQQTVLVGDRKEDVIAAHANGIACIGVGYGFGSREELTSAGADLYVETLTALRKELLP